MEHATSVQGRALVASPYLSDPNFLRSVVYILRHDLDGALGVILNRPLPTTIGKLLGQLTDATLDNNQPIFCGGPVGGPLMMLQRIVDEGSEVVCLATDQERILATCSTPKSDPTTYRVFDGYAGWGSLQLESELESGGWLVWDIFPDQIFCDPENLWQSAVREIGRDILAGGIDPSKMPKDPAYN